MEIKISLKDGDKSTSFKFAGDPLEIVDGLVSKLSMLWGVATTNLDDEIKSFFDRG